MSRRINDASRGRGPRPTGKVRRGLIAALAALGLALGSAGLMVATAAPALAHNVLVSTDPADGASLTEAPEKITLTFDQAVSTFEPVLKVFGPNGNDFSAPTPTVLGSSISTEFSAGEAGDYRVAYRIVSADGHPVTGEYHFTLTEAAAGDATGTPADQEAASDSDEGGSVTTWVWVLVGMAVAVLIIALVIVAQRRR